MLPTVAHPGPSAPLSLPAVQTDWATCSPQLVNVLQYWKRRNWPAPLCSVADCCLSFVVADLTLFSRLLRKNNVFSHRYVFGLHILSTPQPLGYVFFECRLFTFFQRRTDNSMMIDELRTRRSHRQMS